jgi:hypothetical protein
MAWCEGRSGEQGGAQASYRSPHSERREDAIKRDYRDCLESIGTAIDEWAEFTRGMSCEEFTQDRRTVNAVVRSLEVLADAAKCHPPETLYF